MNLFLICTFQKQKISSSQTRSNGKPKKKSIKKSKKLEQELGTTELYYTNSVYLFNLKILNPWPYCGTYIARKYFSREWLVRIINLNAMKCVKINLKYLKWPIRRQIHLGGQVKLDVNLSKKKKEGFLWSIKGENLEGTL